MTTHNHTAITTGAAANASTINSPLGQLDAAVGQLSTLRTKTKTSMVAAANDLFNGLRSGATYEARGGITWNPTTKILTMPASSYILHGNSGKYLSFTSTVTLDFSSIGSNTIAFAYVTGVDVTAVQSGYSTSNIAIETFSSLSRNLADPDVYVLAVYTSADNGIRSPFLDVARMANLEESFRSGSSYEARGGISWDPATYILTLTANTYIIHGRSGKYLSFTSNVTMDFSSFVGGNNTVFAYVTGVDVTAVQSGYSTANVAVEAFTSLSRNLTDPDVYVLAVYTTASKEIRSPFFRPLYQERFAVPWNNLYGHLLPKLSGFASKLAYPTADVRIVMWGDSIFAREVHTSAGSITPSELPPCLITRNLAWYLWDNLPMKPAVYRRYDAQSSAYFYEVGTWKGSTDGDNTSNSGADTNWDDDGDRPGYTRISDSTNAAFTWILGTEDDRSGCNLIYRTDTAGDAAATIAVTQGDGYLEYWNGSAWAEANGATFSMAETDEGARRGNTIYQRRLRLRKATANANASVEVTVGKASADTDRLLYWGVELYDAKNGKYIPMLINSARGGHTLTEGASQLYDYMDDDVLDQDPDLVILQLPLINMMNVAGATVASIRNSVQDMIWGDRAGNTNTWNLKTISSDWADFEVLVVLPHFIRTYYASDSTDAEPITDVTARQVWNAVKQLFISHDDVALIDMLPAFEREIDADPRYNGLYYSAMAGSSAAGLTYTTDGTHQNDRGTLVYARHLAPLLDLSSY